MWRAVSLEHGFKIEDIRELDMKKVIAVTPSELGAVWPTIREEVASIEAPDGCLPEDVYMMCKLGHASLFLLEVDEKRVGFAVIRLNLPDLHIWQLKAENGYEVMTQFRDELNQVAIGAGAKHITYGSSRKAWSQVAAKHGFKMRMVVYESNVSPPSAPGQDIVASDSAI